MTDLLGGGEDAIAKLRALRDDLPNLFAPTCLKIRQKDGSLAPLLLNSAQRYIHAELERQRKETGKVRAIILKGRQQGCSTLIAARFYHKASLNRGRKVYILAHEQPAAENLFQMVERYHRNNPLAPHVGTSNVKELVFDRLESSYVVATAGQKAGGRGQSATHMHGSEAAFWPNAADHFAASVQTVPDLPETEVVLESTANGTSGEFYERWHQALAGEGDYRPIFVPWFWQEEYRRAVPEGFELRTEAEEGDLSEAEYAEMYGLDLGQMAWRRAKIAELRSARLFDQEYPATASVAFQNAQKSSFIEPLEVLRARKRKVEPGGPLIIGVDPAGPGGDRFAVAFRRGFVCEKIVWRDKLGSPEAVAWLRDIIDRERPDAVYVDAGGLGSAVIGFLRAAGDRYARVVHSVNFGAPSGAKRANPRAAGPKNRRAEMWQRMRDWLTSDEGAQIPDLDALQADLTGPMTKPTLDNTLLLESKEEMRKRGVRSPDLGDALALTFASVAWTPTARPTQAAAPVYGEPDRAPRPAHTLPDWSDAGGFAGDWMGF